MDCDENAVRFRPVSQAQIPRSKRKYISGAYSFLLSTKILVLLFI